MAKRTEVTEIKTESTFDDANMSPLEKAKAYTKSKHNRKVGALIENAEPGAGYYILHPSNTNDNAMKGKRVMLSRRGYSQLPKDAPEFCPDFELVEIWKAPEEVISYLFEDRKQTNQNNLRAAEIAEDEAKKKRTRNELAELIADDPTFLSKLRNGFAN